MNSNAVWVTFWQVLQRQPLGLKQLQQVQRLGPLAVCKQICQDRRKVAWSQACPLWLC
jgi:hypothetical protein